MSRPLILLLLTFPLVLPAADLPLQPDKEQMMEHKKSEIDSGAEALRYNWLAPLNLSLSHSRQKSAGASDAVDIDRVSGSWNQDLFRSGGIYYATRYANDKHAYDRLGWEEERDALNLSVVTAVLGIRKQELQCERSETLLKNLDIALFIKRRQYEAGAVDITELNDALMAKNSEQKNLLALRQSLEDQRTELKKYSDREADAISLPEFRVIDRESYLAGNYAAERARRQSEVAYDTYRVTAASYLPALSFDTQAAYSDYDTTAGGEDGNSYSVGLTLSLPLEYNSLSTVQTQRAAMLRQRAEAADARREESLAYEQLRNLVTRYEKEIGLLEENLELYDTLIDVTRQGVKSGYKTGYDLQTLENTRRIAELEIAVDRVNIQLELAKLHYQSFEKGMNDE